MNLTALLFSILLVPGLAQGLPSKEKPGDLFIKFGHAFFESHRRKPLKQWVDNYKDSNSGEIDEWHTEFHPGVRFEYIRSKAYKGDELSGVTFTAPIFKLPLGIQLGDSPERIKSIFGEPTSSQPEFYEYDVGGPALPDVLRFRFRYQRLIEFEIGYEHD